MSTLKEQIGCWLHERWHTETVLNPVLARLRKANWVDLCNRHETLRPGSGADARACPWQDSSALTVARLFPTLGARLYRHCFAVADEAGTWGGSPRLKARVAAGADAAGGTAWPLRLLSSPKAAPSGGRPKLSVILPAGGRERLVMFQYVLQSFFGQDATDFEIIVVEHSPAPLYQQTLGDRAVYRHVPDPEAETRFNKSRALNEGARLAKAPWLLLHDSDIIVPRGYVARVMEHLAAGWDAVRPLRFLFNLSRDDSQEFISRNGRWCPKRIESVTQNFPGGATALTKDAYWALGGHDEDFLGWGGEDNEFLDRLLTRRIYQGGFVPAVHLWHAAAPKKSSGHRNTTLLQEKRGFPPEQRIRRLRERQGA